jgi:hypothetical protein
MIPTALISHQKSGMMTVDRGCISIYREEIVQLESNFVVRRQ